MTDQEHKSLSEANTLLLAAKVGEDIGLARKAAKVLLDTDPALTAWFLEHRAGISPQTIAWEAVRMRLMRGDYEGAATILWGPELFTVKPRSVRMIWSALLNEPFVSFLGASAEGKTFTPSCLYFLLWLAAPDRTRVDLVSINEDKLKKQLFAGFVNLHANASIALPGIVDTESISINRKTGYGIFTTLIRRGSVSAGALKGFHRKTPATTHPVFGRDSFRYVLIDEAQDVDDNVYQDLGNIKSSLPEETAEQIAKRGNRRLIQITLTANPKDPNSKYGQNCKPVGGWTAIDYETAEEWRSETGAWCVRLDATRSENYLERRVVHKNFQTFEGAKAQLKACGGDDSHPDYWTYVRGMFPPAGPWRSLITHRQLAAQEGEWIFRPQTVKITAGADIGHTGDSPALTIGRVGQAESWRTSTGAIVTLKEPLWAIQHDLTVALPLGDTQEVADELFTRLRPTKIAPECLAVDMTGARGVFDLLRRQWEAKSMGPSILTREQIEALLVNSMIEHKGNAGRDNLAPVMGVNYAEKPTNRKLAEEDSIPADELYLNMAAELWYSTAKLFELGVIRHRALDNETSEELVSRKGGRPGKRGKMLTVESKELHKRVLGGRSPDRADSFTLFGFASLMVCPELRPRHAGTPAPEPDTFTRGGVPASGGAWELRGAAMPRMADSDDVPAGKQKDHDMEQLWEGDIIGSEFNDDTGDPQERANMAEALQKRFVASLKNLFSGKNK